MTCHVKFLESHYQKMVGVLRTAKLNIGSGFSFARQATIFNMSVGQVEPVLLFWKFCGMLSVEEDFSKVYSDQLKVLKRVMKANAYDYVICHYNRLGKIFSEGKRALRDKFYSLNLIEVYEQQNHKPKLFKKVKLNGVTMDCLWLKWRVISQLLNQINPDSNNFPGSNFNGFQR